MPSFTHDLAYRSLVALLKRLRRSSGMTQADLAVRLELTQSSVSKIERGERRLDVLEFAALCHAAGADPAVILSEFLQDQIGIRVPRGQRRSPKGGNRRAK